MRVPLPCKLGEEFETVPDIYGRTYHYRLTGFDRGVGSIDGGGYNDPTIRAKVVSEYRQNTSFLHAGQFIASYEVEIPDRLMELHPVSEHGVNSKASAYLFGVNLNDDGAPEWDFVYPNDRYRHQGFVCPDLDAYLEDGYKKEIKPETEVINMATATTRERLRFTDEQIEQANGVDLLDLARQYGYELEDKERKAFHAKHSGGLYFYKDNNTFKHFGSDTKGGAINFIMMMESISFVDAVKRLLGPSYEPMREATPRVYTPPPEKKELILPKKATDFKRAYWYLVEKRGIDPSIVSALMNEKKLYQGTYPVEETGKFESVCVFVGYDETGKGRFCAMRGADPDSEIKQDKIGSDKGIPFHMVGRSKKVYVLEAPIDAASHATLAMLHGIDWRRDHRITTGCLADNALQWFLKQHPEITDICWGYDNDKDGKKPVPITREEYDAAAAAGDDSVFLIEATGKPMKRVPYNWGQEAALAAARKYKGMGYRVSIHTPDDDFNADLVAFRQRAAVREPQVQAADEENEEPEPKVFSMMFDRNKVDYYKRQYPKGIKIELDQMDDPYSDMPKGLKGIVEYVDDAAQIHCIWENGSHLALIPGVDAFHSIKEQESAVEPDCEPEEDMRLEQ